MPEPSGLGAPRRRARAIQAIEAWIAGLPGPKRPLTSRELSAYSGAFFQGWRFDVLFADATRRIDLLLGPDFPRSAVRFALVDRPEFAAWPHVERDGLLCLVPDAGSVSAQNVVGVTRALFSDAVDLVHACVTGANEQDLRDEFASYWQRDSVGSGSPTFSIVEASGPSRLVRVWDGDQLTVIGDDDDAVTRWLHNRNRSAVQKRYATSPGILVWRPQPLLPAEYPKTGRDLLALIGESAPELNAELEKVAFRGEDSIIALIGSTTRNGPCFGAATLDPLRIGNARWRRVESPLTKGFRPHHVPQQILTRRRFGVPVRRGPVERADAAWVHGRGTDPRVEALRNKRVVVLGCGSVGAPVAISLTQAGVGQLDLVDADALRFANVGRHPLGAEYVGRGKAVALAERIRAMFPHAVGIRGHGRRWLAAARNDPALLGAADLIVSAMGDWLSEGELNEWHLETARKVRIVYGWTEAHACAGHAVLVGATGGCLQCGLDDHGASKYSVTEWSHGPTVRNEPGCGAMYQPYGPIELSHITSLVSELALDALVGAANDATHRIWAARKALLDSCGGRWSSRWLADGAPAGGGVVREREWGEVANCPECGRRSAA